jgi:pimeloyl-ACP methyl ester carboxylesterase
MDTVTSLDGTTIAYERHGSGPALVAVDAAMNYSAFRPLVPPVALLADRFTVVQYERRGRGASGDTAPYAVEREVEDLAAVIGAAGGKAYVYGMSSGCLLALRAAASGLPIAKLALFEPPFVAREESAAESAYAAELDRLIAAGQREAAVDYTMREIVGVPEELLAGMPPATKAAQEAVVHTMPYDVAISESTTSPLVRSVTVPTLVLASQASGPELAEALTEVLRP